MGVSPSPSQDRRTRLWRLLSDEPDLAMTPQDRGQLLLDNLLRPRVRRVYIEAARPWPEPSEDLVHDLRVASRRLVEALALIRPMIGKVECKAVQGPAKALRQALGAQRESDVRVQDLKLLALKAELAPKVLRALDGLGAPVATEAPPPQQAYPPERLLGLAIDAMELSPQPDIDLSWAELATTHLQRRLRRAQPLLSTLNEPALVRAHHAMRISCKQLRYTVEIVGRVFLSLSTSDVLRTVKRLQDVLGELNDAQDLRIWLNGPELGQAIGASAARKLCATADQERIRRYEVARQRCEQEGPALFEGARALCDAITRRDRETR